MRVGQSRKRDANEPDIVEALRTFGAAVIRISEKGAPDLIVLFRGKLFAMEVKSRVGKLTKAQEDSGNKGWPVVVVRSVNEALIAIGAIYETNHKNV